jgi:hypothetical protein
MANRIAVCNQALLYLGQSPIVSFDDSDVGAMCNTFYDEARDSLLTERVWSFALVRKVISNKTALEWGTGYKFQIPSDVLMVHRVYESPDSEYHNRAQVRDWRTESGYIVANVDSIYAHLVMRVIDENAMPPVFRSALAARLARDLAIPVTHNSDLLTMMQSLYEKKIDEASAADGRQGSQEFPEVGRFITVRH